MPEPGSILSFLPDVVYIHSLCSVHMLRRSLNPAHVMSSQPWTMTLVARLLQSMSLNFFKRSSSEHTVLHDCHAPILKSCTFFVQLPSLPRLSSHDGSGAVSLGNRREGNKIILRLEQYICCNLGWFNNWLVELMPGQAAEVQQETLHKDYSHLTDAVKSQVLNLENKRDIILEKVRLHAYRLGTPFSRPLRSRWCTDRQAGRRGSNSL